MYLQSHFLNLSWVQSCRNPARFLPPSASQRLLGNWNFSCIQYPDYLMNHLLNSSKSTGHSRRVTNCNNEGINEDIQINVIILLIRFWQTSWSSTCPRKSTRMWVYILRHHINYVELSDVLLNCTVSNREKVFHCRQMKRLLRLFSEWNVYSCIPDIRPWHCVFLNAPIVFGPHFLGVLFPPVSLGNGRRGRSGCINYRPPGEKRRQKMRESRRKADAGTRDCGCLTERGETHTRKKKNKTGLCVYLIRPGVLMMNANTWE